MKTPLHESAIYTLVILTSGSVMLTAKSMGDIINHLGGLPRSFAVKTIYSSTEPTFEEAEEIADFPDFAYITAHVNLV